MSTNHTVTMKMFLSRIVTSCALLLAFAATATATTFTVTNTNDSGGGSLRAAIAAAAPNDTVFFDPGLDGLTITLSGNEIAVSQNVTIDATALPNGISIAGGAPNPAYGGLSGFTLRPFSVTGGTLTLRRITMKSCGGVGLLSNQTGGAIRITGSGWLDAYDCTFDSNKADRSGGAISCASITGRVSLTRCTFSNNFVQNDNGSGSSAGAIVCGGSLNATNCTFFQNGTPTVSGGGVSAAAVYVYVIDGTKTPPVNGMFLTHCTFSGNYAGSNGTAQQGCVVINLNADNDVNYCTMTNCIVAGTTNGLGSTVTDVLAVGGSKLVYNLGNLVQSSSGTIDSGTITQTGNPLLGPLAFNGGPTKTMALLTGSPALNTGGNGGGGPTTDQRGFARIRDGNGSGTGAAALPDLGAYEAQVTPNSIGLNFVGGGGGPGGSLGASERAGVPALAQANWNNLTTNDDGTHTGSYTNGPAALKDANGATISPNLKLWWYAPNTYSINGSAQSTPDGKLMNGYLDSNGAAPTGNNLYDPANSPFLAVSGLPSSFALGGYKVLVYADGEATGGRIGSYWLTGNDGQNPANISNETLLTATIFVPDRGNFSDGNPGYVRATSTSDTGGATSSGNYVRFDALAGNGFIVNAEESSGAGLRAPINAVQIVRNEMIVVTTLVDELDAIGTPGNGVSLREALRDAPDGAGILFDPSLFPTGGTIALGSTINIAKNVTIDASNIPSPGITISGGGAVLPFTVGTGFSVSFAGLTIANGFVAYDGGAIYNTGNLTLTRCTLTGNSVGTLGAYGGGAIFNFGGMLTMTQCTLTGNTCAVAKSGGAVHNTGTMVATHCTFAGNANTGSGGGGGIYNSATGTLTLNNCIVATNTGIPGPDIRNNGGTVIPMGANLIGTRATVPTEFPLGPLVGQNGALVNPVLGPLASNGGPTQTMLPQAGSLAIDAVPAGSILPGITTDQRGTGFGRKRGVSVDLGAVESGISNRNRLDITGGNLPDLIFQSASTGQLYIWALTGTGASVDLGTNTGCFANFFLFGGSLPTFNYIGLGDVDSDGIPDLIFQHKTTGQVYVWLLDGSANGIDFNTGSGLKKVNNVPQAYYLFGGSLVGWRLAAIGDVSGDGIPDLIFQNNSTGQLQGWYLDGTGASIDLGTRSGIKSVGFLFGGRLDGWRLASVDDMNNDGNPDLVFQNTGNGVLYVWFLNGTGAGVDLNTLSGITGHGIISGYGLLSGGQGWNLVVTGDVNGDGIPDLIFQNTSTGQLIQWNLDGSGTSINLGNSAGLKANGFLYGGGLGGWLLH